MQIRAHTAAPRGNLNVYGHGVYQVAQKPNIITVYNGHGLISNVKLPVAQHTIGAELLVKRRNDYAGSVVQLLPGSGEVLQNVAAVTQILIAIPRHTRELKFVRIAGGWRQVA